MPPTPLPTMKTKPKFPREEALEVAQEIYDRLLPFCERCKVVGSLRRGKRFVSDIEILFIPKMAPDPTTFFDALLGTGEAKMISMAETVINRLEKDGFLKKRLSETGVCAWGEKNKLAVHVETGIPVDLFATTAENWWNSLVIRTGGKRTNLLLTMGANKRGYTLHAYGSGFTKRTTGETIQTTSEQDVFSIAGVPYARPEFRP